MNILSIFKWYRKFRGGKWYKIYLIGTEGGMESGIEYWTRQLPTNCNDIEILKKEEYK